MVIGNNYGRGQEKQRVERATILLPTKDTYRNYRIVVCERNGKKV